MRKSLLVGVSPPTRSKVLFSNTRNNFAWRFMETSAISSRNSVPPSASSIFPIFWRLASVKAPFSCPNSSDSMRVAESSERLIARNGPFLRGLKACAALAKSSLPVPLSPEMRMGISRLATFFNRSKASINPCDWPTMLWSFSSSVARRCRRSLISGGQPV